MIVYEKTNNTNATILKHTHDFELRQTIDVVDSLQVSSSSKRPNVNTDEAKGLPVLFKQLEQKSHLLQENNRESLSMCISPHLIF